jgi:hypothetical protein
MITPMSKENISNIIYRENECIVNVKDPIKGKNLSYKKTIGKYVCKVDPIRAILEPDYFIKMIEEAEIKRGKQIEKIELGF